MPKFTQVTIVGLGLIGGSLGMAIRRKKLAREVIGLSRAASTIAQAKRVGAIDRGTTNAVDAVRDADLVVLASPVDAIVPQALKLARHMKPGAIITDVGSTKGAIVARLERRLPKRVRFVGAHPLAGSEERGIRAARRSLFDRSLCVVTKTRRTNARALSSVRALWAPLVHRVVVMDPESHDRALAAISHLPHLLAFCLVDATSPAARALAPRSFLEATRVAKSDPELWDDIFLSNRGALFDTIDRFGNLVCAARKHLQRGDAASLRRMLRRAQRTRLRMHD